MQRILPTCVLLLVTLATAACSGTPARTSRAPGATDDAAAARLYARLDAGSRAWLAGMDVARHGDAAQARAEMSAALDEIHAAAAECAGVAGCDPQRFVDVLDTLLRQGIEAGPVPVEGDVGTTPEATTQAGESSPVVAALPQLGRTITLLKGRELGDIIALNGPVKAALEEWLTQYRPNLLVAYENYQYMRYLMWPEYEKAGLPEALLFGMLAKESGGKVHAVSRSGASGPLQFMYATGTRFGLATVDGFDQRFDPRLSARANAAYIDEQLAIFNNNLELVIGAYNGGEGAMRRRVARAGGSPSFWDPAIYRDLSQETREYVPMVLAAAWLFMHPERYKLEFPHIDGNPGSITLARPASLAELSVCLGQDGNPDGWFRTLRNLNPQLDPQRAEPAGSRLHVPHFLETVYARDCAGGRWAELAADLHSAIVPTPPPVAIARRQAPKSRRYVVRKGDTLHAISQKSGCGSVREIAGANHLRAPHYPIKPGQVLVLPECGG